MALGSWLVHGADRRKQFPAPSQAVAKGVSSAYRGLIGRFMGENCPAEAGSFAVHLLLQS